VCPNAPKQHKKTIFWLFWTISPTRIGLLISLGPYFQAKTLDHISRPLAGLCLPFWVHLGLPKCPKIAPKKNYFLVVLDHFSYKNGHIDLVGGFFRAKVLGHTSPSTCWPLFTFFGPMGGVYMPQTSIKKTIFWLFWTISPTRMGILIWLGAFFQTKMLGHTSSSLADL
jgi:hypothetical protein